MIKKFLNYVCPGYLKPEIEFADGKKKELALPLRNNPLFGSKFSDYLRKEKTGMAERM